MDNGSATPEGVILAFTICAVAGSALFIIKTLLQFIGSGMDADVDIADGDVDISNSGLGFKMLSFHGISAFVMIFGLAGRAFLLDSRLSVGLSVLGATLLGAFTVWVIAVLFKIMQRLQSQGGRVDLSQAVGQEGEVYLTIPPEGIGRITVSFQGRQKNVDAVSDSDVPLETGTRVKVTRMLKDDLLSVVKVNS